MILLDNESNLNQSLRGDPKFGVLILSDFKWHHCWDYLETQWVPEIGTKPRELVDSDCISIII